MVQKFLRYTVLIKLLDISYNMKFCHVTQRFNLATTITGIYYNSSRYYDTAGIREMYHYNQYKFIYLVVIKIQIL